MMIAGRTATAAAGICGCAMFVGGGSSGVGLFAFGLHAMAAQTMLNVTPMWRWRAVDPAVIITGSNVWTRNVKNVTDRHVPIAVKADIAPPPTFPTTPTGGTILVMLAQEW